MNNSLDLLDSELLEVWMKEIHQEKFEFHTDISMQAGWLP
jgi:hypothetical protein